MVLSSMSGLTLFIVSYAPNAEVGGLMSYLMVVLKAFGWISPLRYTADGMVISIAGQSDVFVELVILGAFAAVLLGGGLWKLRWLESYGSCKQSAPSN